MSDLTENVAKNVANEKVQDLTEQFNNDELDDRLYYFKQKMSDNVEVGRPFAFNMVRVDDGEYLDWFLIDKVLAPVPSYEEWKSVCDDCNSMQETIFSQDSIYCENENLLEEIEKIDEENTKLKELLKEYKKQLSEIKNAYTDLTTQDEYGSYYIDEAKLFVEIVGKIIKDFVKEQSDD